MKIFKFFAVAAIVLMSLACTEQLETPDALTVTSTEVSVSNDAATQDLSFSANKAWTIEVDQTWVTFDKVSGEAGDVTVVMTVAANDTYEARTANVSVKAGEKVTKIVVKQGFATEFTSEVVYKIDAKAQTIEFAINTNLACTAEIEESAKSWISEVKAKAAPAASTLSFSVSANSELGPRTGKVYVKAGTTTQCLVINQDAEFVVMSEPEVIYLGKTMDLYDDNTSTYLNYDEYAITFKTDEGTVTLALNYDVLEDALAGVPAGEFVVDAAANHAAGTFAIRKPDNSEKFYTTIVKGTQEIVVEDGEISVEVEEGEYTIVATLVDGLETLHRYSYKGELGEITDLSDGANFSSIAYQNTYYTHFSSQANTWTVYLQMSKIPFEGTTISGVTITLHGPAGEVDYKEIPTGTFTIVEDKNIESSYASGIRDVKAGDAFLSFSSSDWTWSGSAKIGGTVTVGKNDDGTYKFDFDVTTDLKWDEYDDDYNLVETHEKKDQKFEKTFDNIVKSVEVSDNQSYPTPDMDDELNTVMSSQYTALYWGDVWSTGGAAFTIGFMNVNWNYTVYLTLNQAEAYTYEKNFRNRFCNTPFEDGTYEFSKTPAAGKLSLVPVKYGASSYSYVKNAYTGTTMIVTGGSVTLDKGVITYNLEATAGGQTYKFTGSHAATLYYAQDYTKRAPNLTIAE